MNSIPEQMRQATDEIIRAGREDRERQLGQVNERLGQIEAALKRIEEVLATMRNDD